MTSYLLFIERRLLDILFCRTRFFVASCRTVGGCVKYVVTGIIGAQGSNRLGVKNFFDFLLSTLAKLTNYKDCVC